MNSLHILVSVQQSLTPGFAACQCAAGPARLLTKTSCLQIKDDDRENALGTLVVSMSQVLKEPEMTLDQRFQLDHSSPDSFIKMKLVLRVSCPLSCISPASPACH